MPKTLAHLLVRLGVDAAEFGQKMKAAERTMDKVAAGMKKAGTSLSLYVTAPMLAAAGASLKMAMNAQESENLFEVAMGGMADSARRFSERLRDELGLNSYAVRENVGTFHQMFTAMGLSEQGAYDMATSLTELAYDMSSFFNLRPEEAFEKLRAGITGEAEPLKRLGILIDETTIKHEAWNSGLVATGEELTQVQKVQARYLAIMRQTANAQGDLARTAESPTNQLRRLRAQAEETAVEFGNALMPLLVAALPTLKDMADLVRSAADALNRMDPETRRLALGIAMILAAAGPLLRITSPLIAAGGATAGVFKKAAAAARTLAKTQTLVAASTTVVTTATGNAQLSTARLVKAQGTAKTAAVTLTSANVALAGSFRAVWAAALGVLAPIVAAALAGLAAGRAMRPWVNETLGLAEAMGLVAEKHQDLAEGLLENKETFDAQLELYNQIREKYGLVGKEFEVGTKRTWENASALAYNIAQIEKMQAAQRAAGGAIRETTRARVDATEQVKRHLERIKEEDEALGLVTENLREMYGILSRQDVVDQMDELVADFKLLARDGASGAQLMEKFAPEVQKLADAAKGYTDLDIPNEFSELQWTLEQGLPGWVDTLATRFARDIPDSAGVAKLAISSSFRDAMLDAEGTVKEGYENISEILGRLTGQEFKIKVKPDVEGFSDELQRMLKELGITPDTTGTGG